jgi:DNA mismatch repair protein MSH3
LIVSRFRAEFINECLPKLAYAKERLQSECDKAWIKFLKTNSIVFQKLMVGVKSVSKLDCLLSLACVSNQEGFCRPQFVNNSDNRILKIKDGRNIIVDYVLSMQPSLQYVPNDIELDASKTRGLILTGPNMGGKSCFLRQIGMAALMAQVGCYVAGREAILPIFDAIFVRIGARDDLWTGRSTLKVELDEACTIIENASSKSLVLIDELGRGTSTHDGCAIAKAVLNKLIQIECFVVFVTHFKRMTSLPQITTGIFTNGHMDYHVPELTDEDIDKSKVKKVQRNVSLLYKYTPGPAGSSFGTNVARLAGVPESIVDYGTTLALKFERNSNRNEEFARIINDGNLNYEPLQL